MSAASIIVVHHEPDHDGLKEAVGAFLAAVKDSDAPPHLTYKPMADTLEGGKEDMLKFVWARHDDGDPHASVLDEDQVAGLAAQASGAMKGLGTSDLVRTRTGGGSPGKAPKYVVALGFRYDPAKHDVIKEAADAFDEANDASASPLSYSVYKTGAEGGRLVLFGLDEIDESLTKKRMSAHHGMERAQELKAKLEDAVISAYAAPLELVPELSNI